MKRPQDVGTRNSFKEDVKKTNNNEQLNLIKNVPINFHTISIL